MIKTKLLNLKRAKKKHPLLGFLTEFIWNDPHNKQTKKQNAREQHIEDVLIDLEKDLSNFQSSLQTKDKAIKDYVRNSFLPFHSSIFHSKTHKHPACKLNRNEHGKSRLEIRRFERT